MNLILFFPFFSAQQNNTFDEESGWYRNLGKWLLFYDHENIDQAWKKAKRLYMEGQLEGVSFLKVSTACRPRKSSGKICKYTTHRYYRQVERLSG